MNKSNIYLSETKSANIYMIKILK